MSLKNADLKAAQELHIKKSITSIASKKKSVADLLARSPKVRVGETDAPVTIDGYNGTIARASILWGYEEISPFLNREDSVLALLNIAFENWSVNNDKPKIVTKCTTSGSGKTRLLLEWPVRAFASPSVLKEFFGDGTDATDVKTKEQFVNDLWATIHQQRIIVFQCCDVPNDVDNKDLLRHIIVECINSRFRDCTFKYDNKSTTVEDLPEPQAAAEAVKMFNQIIDENYSRPEQFYNATSYNFKPFLLFLGDQIQAWKHQRVNNLLSQIAQLRQQLDTPCTAYVTGLFIKLPLVPEHYRTVDVPMGGLLELRYLNDMCMGVLKCKLHHNMWPDSKAFHCRELDETTSYALQQAFMKSCGHPRAIADLFRSSPVCRFLSASAAIEQSNVSASQMEEEFSEIIRSYYAHNWLARKTPLRTSRDEEQLLIQAALCWEVDPALASPLEGKSYGKLAKDFYLIPWKSTGWTTQYTFPFLLGDWLDTEVEVLRPRSTLLSANLLEKKITYSQLLLPQTFGVSMKYGNVLTGTSFEDTIAATLYTRFLVLTQYRHDKVINLRDLIPAPWFGRLGDAKVQIHGVVRPTKHLHSKSTEVFTDLFDSKYIAVDSGNSVFANVILPVFFDDEPQQYFIGVQASNNKRIEGTTNLVPAQEVLKNDNFFYLALLPGPGPCEASPDSIDSALLDEWRKQNRYLQQNCEKWLSPWFISMNRYLQEKESS